MALTRIPATGVNSLQSFTFANVTSNANLNTSNLTANGTVNFTGPNVTLGSVSNLHISGGTTGYVLSTDGSGTLSWVAQSGGGGSYSNANVASYLPTYTGNITAGNVNATGNVSASYVLGNGSQLTGLPATYSNTNVASYLPTYTGNLTAGNTNVSGNSTASYFIGDGSQLTGISGSYSNTNVAAYLPTYTGNLTAGNITVNTDLSVTGNSIITGNLTVQGNTTYVNVDTLRVEDPIIELGGGPNGAPLSSNDGKDRGTLLHYYTSTTVDAFMGWDVSNSEFAFGSNVSVTNDVVTYNSFGNVRANNFLGNGSQLTGVTAVTAQTVTNAAQPNITSTGTLSSLNVSGNISSGGNVTAQYFIGNGSALTGITSSQISGAYSNTNVAAYLPTYTGNLTAGNATITNNVTLSGDLTVNSNVIFSNATANFTVGNLIASGNLTTGGNANLQVGNLFTGTGSGGTIAGANLVSANYFQGNGYYLTGIVAANVSGSVANANYSNFAGTAYAVSGGNVSGQVGNALIAGTVYTAAQPNITSVGTLSSLTVSGLITATGTGIRVSNIQDSSGTTTLTLSGGNANVYNNLNVGTSGAGNVTASYFIGNGSQLTGLPASYSNTNVAAYLPTYTGNITAGNVTATGNVSANYILGNGSQLTSLPGGAFISNGTSNVSVPTSGGNVTVGIGGTANVVVISSAGITLAANDNVSMSGTLSQLTGANLVSATNLTGTLTTGAQPNITSVGTMQSITMAAATSISGGNLLSANFVTGTLTTAAQPNITSVGTLASLNVTGNVSSAANVTAQFFIGNGSQLTGISAGGGASISNGTSNVNIPSSGGNVTVSVGGTTNVAVFSTDAITLAANADITMSGTGSQLTGANLVSATNLTGTLTTAAQPNITSVGTLTGLTVTGNTTSGNYHTAGSITASTLISNVATGTAPLTITSTTRVNNLNVAYANVSDFNVVTAQTTGTFYPTLINGATTANYALGANANFIFYPANGRISATGFIGDGSALTNIPIGTSLSNGTSNVSIPSSGGNILFGVGGTANVIQVTTSGAVLNANANITLSGSLSQLSGANLVSATNLTGTLTTAAQTNITSVGSLTGLTVTGNTTSGNYHTAGSITASRLISNVATGTAPFTVTSTTVVPNLYVSRANVSDFGAVTAQTTGTWYPTLSNGATTANYALGANTNLSFNAATGALSATLFTGTLSTGAQPNITSVGTLSSLTLTANGNITMSGSQSQLSGANLVSATNLSGTLTTAAQTNITSVGSLTGLTVTGNTTSGNYHTAGSITASTLISNVATGTAPFTVTSTTRVNNLNVNYANVSDFNVVTAQTTGTWYPTLINGATTANYALGANNALLFYPANGRLSATGFLGDGSALTGVSATSFANGTSNLSIPVASGNVNISAGGTANVLSVSSSQVSITGNTYSTGWLILESTTEILNTKTGATGTVTHDLATGLTFYHTTVAANFTINFTNVPTTNDRTINATIIILQGATAYYPSAVQVDGVGQTLRWLNGVTPTATANYYEIYAFSLIRTGSAWIVLATVQSFN